MALGHSKEQDSGVFGTYWRVEIVSVDARTYRCVASVALYLDAAARQAGKIPLHTGVYALTGYDVAAMEASNPIALTYTKLKELAEFAGALDV